MALQITYTDLISSCRSADADGHIQFWFDYAFTADIQFGTPPQSFQLELDTGSPDTRVFVAGSGNPPPYYDPTASSTFVNTTRPYIFQYVLPL